MRFLCIYVSFLFGAYGHSFAYKNTYEVCSNLMQGVDGNYTINDINRCADKQHSLNDFLCPPIYCSHIWCPLGYMQDAEKCDVCNCTEYYGDVRLTAKVQNVILHHSGSTTARGSAESIWLWDTLLQGDKFIIPYNLSPDLSEKAKVGIFGAMIEIEANTCIKFTTLKPYRFDHHDYVEFVQGDRCSSYIGRNGQRQEITLARGCEPKGHILHEIMHTLGFWHEQSRPDRTDHVKVMWENIESGKHDNFLSNSATTMNLSLPYDVESIMHYDSYAFSANDKPTITDMNGNILDTQMKGLSLGDIAKINALYQCDRLQELENRRFCIDTLTTCEPDARLCRSSSNSIFMKEKCCESFKKYQETACCDVYADCHKLTQLCSVDFLRTRCRLSCNLCSVSQH